MTDEAQDSVDSLPSLLLNTIFIPHIISLSNCLPVSVLPFPSFLGLFDVTLTGLTTLLLLLSWQYSFSLLKPSFSFLIFLCLAVYLYSSFPLLPFLGLFEVTVSLLFLLFLLSVENLLYFLLNILFIIIYLLNCLVVFIISFPFLASFLWCLSE